MWPLRLHLTTYGGEPSGLGTAMTSPTLSGSPAMIRRSPGAAFMGHLPSLASHMNRSRSRCPPSAIGAQGHAACTAGTLAMPRCDQQAFRDAGTRGSPPADPGLASGQLGRYTGRCDLRPVGGVAVVTGVAVRSGRRVHQPHQTGRLAAPPSQRTPGPRRRRPPQRYPPSAVRPARRRWPERSSASTSLHTVGSAGTRRFSMVIGPRPSGKGPTAHPAGPRVTCQPVQRGMRLLGSVNPR
jgi:hypothetical protein